jgi:uncharacterized UBP type Zn finger protein
MTSTMQLARGGGACSPCLHVEAARRLHARSAECAECVVLGEGWAGLLVCLACGWVACSDTSPRQHARGHYQETDHPVATTYEPSDWRWCYVHDRVV